MYARRYSTAQDEKSIVRVPENYAGNAFREEAKEEPPCSCEEKSICQQKEVEEATCEHEEKAANSLLPFFNSKILSSDTLLLLLAFLLMGNGECEDLPGILIFLMLL